MDKCVLSDYLKAQSVLQSQTFGSLTFTSFYIYLDLGVSIFNLPLSLTRTSKNQYLSAKHVSRTPESTQSISSTIQPIDVKLSQNVAYI